MLWRDAVSEALVRYSRRHTTMHIKRQELIQEELPRIVADVGSRGDTPYQTLSRILQELRDEGVLYFLGDGNYLLAFSPIVVEAEDLPADALDIAVAHNNLRLGLLPAADKQAAARRRLGQQKIRQQTLINYGFRCALCDVHDAHFLVAGHILRWADSAEARGDLRNLICMCRFHDALFEQGYFSLSDDYHLVCRPAPSSQMIRLVLQHTQPFRLPGQFPPLRDYLRLHRERIDLVGN